ncbi:glycosyltransferase family 2 protein [Thermosipho sp. 1074]|uniref:glycosyltransferase family 2 protein n=1 Tax=Thermosipho sp. 1074 TaxID=1643331 RepID=UPI000985787D|nr:glycosyltransferase family 2 protein [Thermosipho sp. 1074]OOC44211.1 hypothetical protein XO08_04050 [Thermosipho sp. 1074]
MNAPFPLVSVVILNYYQSNLVERLLKNLEKQNYKNIKIIIVDNSVEVSERSKLEKLKSMYGFDLIFNEENIGYAKGNNVGLDLAYRIGAKYALVLNPDVEISEQFFVNKFVQFMENHKEYAMIGPKVFDSSGNLVRIYFHDENSFWRLLTGNIFDILFFKLKKKKFIDRSSGFIDVFRIYGCCMFLNLEVFKKIGFFDEQTFLYEEENIIAEKLKKSGYKIAYLFNVSVVHKHNSFDIKKCMRTLEIAKQSKIYLLTRYKRYNKIIASLVVNVWKLNRIIVCFFKKYRVKF